MSKKKQKRVPQKPKTHENDRKLLLSPHQGKAVRRWH